MNTNLIQRFAITKESSFEILIPKNKDNYYYKPTNELHEFDIATVVYQSKNQKLTILNDALGLIISVLYHSLIEVLEYRRTLPVEIEIGQVSLYFSIDAEKRIKKLDYSNIWLWSSTTGIQVWLYNKDKKIYLEISRIYPWIFSDPEPSDTYITFDEYKKTYTPLLLCEINETTAKEWREQCLVILKNIEHKS